MKSGESVEPTFTDLMVAMKAVLPQSTLAFTQ